MAIGKVLGVIALLFTGFSVVYWIFSQRSFWYVHRVYVTEFTNGTFAFGVDVTVFMYGIWCITMIAVGIGVVIGYVYGNTSTK